MTDPTKYFREIESSEFSAQMNIASGFKMFEELVTRNVWYVMLMSLTRELGPEILFKRIEELAASEFDHKYENPSDTALAAYVLILDEISHSAALSAAQILNDVKQLWWTKRVINRVQGLSV